MEPRQGGRPDPGARTHADATASGGRLLVPLFHLALLLAFANATSCGGASTSGGVPAGLVSREAYRCPMHPAARFDKPGRCPQCGMDLAADRREPAEARSSVNGGGFSVPESGIRMAGIRTTQAIVGRVSRSVRAAGTVLAEPHRIRHIVARSAGWIEKLEVKGSGERVARGQHLFTLFAPDLVPIQEEYLRFVRARDVAAHGSSTPEAQRRLAERPVARQRIERYQLPEDFLATIEREGSAKASVAFGAPVDGFVQLGEIFENQQIESGMELMTVTDLSEVWVDADLFESDAAGASAGQDAVVTLPYDSRVRRTGRVILVSPFLDTSTRSTKVRLRCPNADLALRPGMFATVELELQSEDGIVVPETAILDTGLRQVAFVETSEGWFEPRNVTLGLRGGTSVHVLTGIEAGERVVVSGNFLLDSESRLRHAAEVPEGARAQ